VISSLSTRLEKTFFLPFLHFLWCVAQRSLHVVTKVYHRSMSCFAAVPPLDTWYHGPACNAKVSQGKYAVPRTLLHYVGLGKISSQSPIIQARHTTYIFLINKEATPYQTRGGTCYPGVSTPKNLSLVDLSTTCHDGSNHLHQSKNCSNHSIDPHTINSHINEWETTFVTLRHDTNSTS
jgi:hypothetical protein